MRFTRLGTFYLLFTIAVGAAAINTGNNLLYIILGIQLSFIIVSGFLSDSVLWGLRSAWHPLGDLFAGQKAQWMIDVRKGWFPAALIKITGEWNQGMAPKTWIPWIAGYKTVHVAIEMTPRQRGWLSFKKVRYGTAFPFGLFEKTHTESRDEKWLVYPRLHTIDLTRLLGEQEGHANVAQAAQAGEGTTPWNIRDYRVGDSLGRMDWKAAAKRQRWMIKETEEETDTSTLLRIKAWPSENLENFISFIASVLWAAKQAQRSLGLHTPDRYLPMRTPADVRALWTYLALVDPKKTSEKASEPVGFQEIDAQVLWEKYTHEQRP